ncbi:hypothetical protein D9758_016001 [Tetrapyrgos nigripes]|uniref:Thioredoxin domain-containing protein n=1 Tax=Tetrapyrgos nigripes TaxID=182062 RepID=A0A8H5FMX7_9AGAR|nr:hypothetical protein D9758_016001 [Tetrapyrgos nigripes]
MSDPAVVAAVEAAAAAVDANAADAIVDTNGSGITEANGESAAAADATNGNAKDGAAAKKGRGKKDKAAVAAAEPSRRSTRISTQPTKPKEEEPAPRKRSASGAKKNGKRGADEVEGEGEDGSNKKAKSEEDGLKIGDSLPSVSLKNEKGEDVHVATLAAEKGVVFFLIPKADTPGCTTQACGYRDIYAEFTSVDYDVYCVSADSSEAQAKWQTKVGFHPRFLLAGSLRSPLLPSTFTSRVLSCRCHPRSRPRQLEKTLPYSLLSDPSRQLIGALGAADKSNKTKRSHFVFEKGGKLIDKKVPVKAADSANVSYFCAFPRLNCGRCHRHRRYRPLYHHTLLTTHHTPPSLPILPFFVVHRRTLSHKHTCSPKIALDFIKTHTGTSGAADVDVVMTDANASSTSDADADAAVPPEVAPGVPPVEAAAPLENAPVGGGVGAYPSESLEVVGPHPPWPRAMKVFELCCGDVLGVGTGTAGIGYRRIYVGSVSEGFSTIEPASGVCSLKMLVEEPLNNLFFNQSASRWLIRTMSTSKLFQPLKVGDSTLKHRVALAPLTRFRANEKHIPLPIVKEMYAQRASTPGTLLITEATFIDARAGGYPHAPGIWSDEQIAAWKEVTSAVHAKGSFIYLQLWALGRTAYSAVLKAENPSYDLVSASDIPLSEHSKDEPRPRPLTVPEIKEYVELYAKAASNAVHKAGFDGVEIHNANGYLLDQFTQDVTNHRTDEYGGSVETRARFTLEVVDAVVKAVGPRKTGIRFSPWNTFQDMGMDSVSKTKAQFSYIVSKIKEVHPTFSYVHVVEPRSKALDVLDHNPEGEDNDFIREIWTSPEDDQNGRRLISAGGYTRELSIEDADKKGDIIAFGRVFIANPDLPYRLEHDIPLNNYDRTTFYLQNSVDPKGYTDYPFAEGNPHA